MNFQLIIAGSNYSFNHRCIFTTEDLVLLSLCKALNFIPTSSQSQKSQRQRSRRRNMNYFLSNCSKPNMHIFSSVNHRHTLICIFSVCHIIYICLCTRPWLLLWFMTLFLCNVLTPYKVSQCTAFLLLCRYFCPFACIYFSLTTYLHWEI